jgi:hypothetical protein
LTAGWAQSHLTKAMCQKMELGGIEFDTIYGNFVIGNKKRNTYGPLFCRAHAHRQGVFALLCGMLIRKISHQPI